MYKMRGASSLASSPPVEKINSLSNNVTGCKSKKGAYLEGGMQSKAARDEQLRLKVIGRT